jgi:hypothetical protein
VFDLLRLQLGSEWSVFHSVGLTLHDTKPWAEIDFVAVGPGGVFCLEVKGGRLERIDGRYRYTNGRGETTIKDQGPFEQVGPASAKLYNFLKNEDSSLRNVTVGYGVVTPDITWKIAGPDVIPEVIFDERDLPYPVERYFGRLIGYWHDRFSARGKHIANLRDGERDRIKRLIRGDFDLRPSLKSRVTQAKAELISLTQEQYRILDDLEENERVVVKGGAGSGKTLLAVEEARRRGRDQKVLLLCYNTLLGDLLKKSLTDSTDVTVDTLHSFMKDLISRAGMLRALPAASKDDLLRKFYPEAALDALVGLNELERYDVLLVDEAQDLLLETYMEVFNAVLKGGIAKGNWRFFMDSNQNLFSNTSPVALAALNAAQPARYSLSINCRNTAPIAVMTALLSGIKAAHTLRVSGPDVVHTEYADKRDQVSKAANAINRLLSQHVPPSDITILGPRRLENSSVAEGLPGVPFPIRNIASIESADRSIQYATFGAFKGLESDYVFIVDIEDLSSAEALLNIYVGASRACAYLQIFTAARIRSQFDERAVEFGRTLANLYSN